MALSALHHSGLKRTYQAAEFAIIAKEEQSDTSDVAARLRADLANQDCGAQ